MSTMGKTSLSLKLTFKSRGAVEGMLTSQKIQFLLSDETSFFKRKRLLCFNWLKPMAASPPTPLLSFLPTPCLLRINTRCLGQGLKTKMDSFLLSLAHRYPHPQDSTCLSRSAPCQGPLHRDSPVLLCGSLSDVSHRPSVSSHEAH